MSFIVQGRAPQDVDVLAVLVFVVVDGQASGIQSRSHRTETRNLEFKDGEDVEVLRRPGPGIHIDGSPNIDPEKCLEEFIITCWI